MDHKAFAWLRLGVWYQKSGVSFEAVMAVKMYNMAYYTVTPLSLIHTDVSENPAAYIVIVGSISTKRMDFRTISLDNKIIYCPGGGLRMNGATPPLPCMTSWLAKGLHFTSSFNDTVCYELNRI